MNAIETLNKVFFYVDITRSARFSYLEVNMAVNDVIEDFVSQKLGDEQHRNPENFQWIQQIRDELYTLLTVATITPTNGTAITNRYYTTMPSHINFPTDYYDFVSLMVLIDGYTDYSRPTSYNDLGPLLKDSFKHPTNEKTYYNEDSTGLTIYRSNSGTFTSATLEYIKIPTEFTLSTESNLINPGAGVLTNGASYIAVETSVQNAVTYPIGTQFTAVGTALTSGQVILASLTSPIPLPEKAQEEICKRAAEVLLGVTSNIQQSQVAEKFAKQGS